MLRQRLRDRTSWVEPAARVILFLFCLALVWYGLMVILLAFGTSPSTVEAISGYRTIYDNLAGLDGGDITGTVRLIAGLGGLAGFLLFGWLAWKEIPRPYRARTAITLTDDEHGLTDVGPRAIERAAETAALGNPTVTTATGRFGGTTSHSPSKSVAPTTSHNTQRRSASSRQLARAAGLPATNVNVTLSGLKRTRRELA